MKLICSKANLLKGVNIVSKAVPTRTTMAILECILIDASANEIKLMANDMELGIETIIDGTIEERGIIALDAKIFSEIVRKLPDNDVTIETDASFKTVMRELHEETGLKVTEEDEVSIINPCLFSTPGMTDESNALVKIVLNRDSLNEMSQEGAVGGELFDGFDLLTKAQAKKILEDGVDEHGIYYSVYTWAALTYFVADLWR